MGGAPRIPVGVLRLVRGQRHILRANLPLRPAALDRPGRHGGLDPLAVDPAGEPGAAGDPVDRSAHRNRADRQLGPRCPPRRGGGGTPWIDLLIAIGLIVSSGLVVPPGEVIGETPFFAVSYPACAALLWGAAR